LATLDAQRVVGTDQHGFARSGTNKGWAQAPADRRHYRQPERQDGAKRGARGYDAGKKIKGRKRHVAVDTSGFLLCVIVHSASLQDRDGAKQVIAYLAAFFSFIKIIWADGGYAGKLVSWVYEHLGWALTIVKRSDTAKGFVLLPRRWVVERFFGWLMFDRLHARDYHHNPRSSEASIYASSVRLLLRRLTRG